MLTTLSISNYALIKELQTDFTKGLSIITGETGAGKSIVLGALGLVMGNRADLNSLKDNSKKCVIEATFSVGAYQLKEFFEDKDLDYEEEAMIRREILPSGKSRAFVNDTPVTLSILNVLKERLIDVHSQHKTAQLSETSYQFQILDALAGNFDLLANYSKQLKVYKKHQKELEVLVQSQEAAKQEYAYNSHLYNELVEANLKAGEQEELEETLDRLNNIEAISDALSESLNLASDEQVGLQSGLYQMKNSLDGIASFSSEYESFASRIESLKIELDDVVFELEKYLENVDVNPSEIESLNDRLQWIYALQKKHMVSSIDELLTVQSNLEIKVGQVENASEQLENKQAQIEELKLKLLAVCDKIHKKRTNSVPKLTKQLEEVLSKLGMPNATFKIEINGGKEFYTNGNDELQFLFSANMGGNYDELKKVASGGEMSRIMLGVKLILSKYTKLPTIIFDEIDTGVSGEVSNKIADVMQEMGDYMQVITITHLPQIAAKGESHFKVYKKDVEGVTTTFLKPLTKEERVTEVAEILGGKTITDSALEHAKELLKA
ncbi:DNA repair protein RecN [Flavicella sp.]|uniref:DNA repair protein RecN n=1 Tax=Flavicella sp. TaxID=2957742 RepID=UPI00262CFBE0|nr:DNA repair protein RecN [Flavicella sp.]MDG1805739.1 DNA repair protein RecN [Flavicella sp.]